MSVTREPRDGVEVSTRIVEAVANVADVDPLAMDPLYDVVDGDALDALCDSSGGVAVRFEYAGHAVAVGHDRRVTVDGDGHQGGERE